MSDARTERNGLRRSRSAPDVPSESNRRPSSDGLSSTQTMGPSASRSNCNSLGRTSTDEDSRTGRYYGPSSSNTSGGSTSSNPAGTSSTSRRTEGSRTQPNRPQDRPPPPQQYHPQRSFIYRMMIYLGYGRGASPNRKIFVSLIWNLLWGFAQIVTIVGILAYAANNQSPTMSGMNEWTACSRPLGVWSCLWIGRVLVACILAFWGWKRDKTTRALRDLETGTPNAVPNSRSPGTPPTQPNPRRTDSHQRDASSSNEPDALSLPHTVLFRRLSLFSSLYSLSWFLTAHILVYTSVKTCRDSSPHLWWLVFGILCITYLMILEVVILGLVVFIIGPLIILLWNIFLICIGRHPIQNPHMIKPEIGKLPKSVVDRIPLVMYIPPPPDAPPTEGPIKIPEAAYSYPPKNPQPTSVRPKRRFKFIGRFSKSNRKEGSTDGKSKTGSEDEKAKADDGDSWEDHWEKDGYPFVVLENNRAACAICLMDFEEPKRIKPGHEHADTRDTLVEPTSKTESSPTATTGSPAESITEEQRERDASNLKLEHAGDGAQPLRLLTCGHVFHKTCLDPWLIDVSGRCPVCQKPVQLPEPSQKKKRSRR